MLIDAGERVLRGPDAIAVYGVCCCEKATLANQAWVVRFFDRTDGDGSIIRTGTVTCGHCGRGLGAER